MDEYSIAVREIQEYLRVAARQHPEIGQVIPDGIYGEETARAVRVFQRINGLPETGRVDIESWNALVRAGTPAEPLIQIVPISAAELPLRRGDSGPTVLAAQRMLLHISARFDNIPQAESSGEFGDGTFRAVTEWQGVTLLPQTGEIDASTWNRLAQFYSI